MDKNYKPFVKWAGGKRQILGRLNEYINDAIIYPNEEYRYIEPFLGGGAVLFNLAPKSAIINDLNDDLINAYKVIQSDDYLKLIDVLKEYKLEYSKNNDEFYYEMRQKDRDPSWPDNTDDVHRAARMIFLNRTCYNGLYRVNSKGQFNTPIGRYVNPNICDEQTITEDHKYLSENQIKILSGSYEDAIKEAKDGDIVYIDPPYDYQDDDGFTKYQMKGFTFEDFKTLKTHCDDAIENEAIVILSNNATDKVINLFEEDPKYKIGYYTDHFCTLRSINSKGNKRKTGNELIILGTHDGIPFPQANDLYKVIKFAMADEICLKDKQKALDILDVTSERQIGYYLSALKYLELVSSEKVFIKEKNEIRQNEGILKKYIIDFILSKKVFYNAFINSKESKECNIEEIEADLRSNCKKKPLSTTTLKRRASTVEAWVNWIKKNSN